MKRFPDREDPTIALGIMLPQPGEVEYIHSCPYPLNLGMRILKAVPALKSKKTGLYEEPDFDED